MEQQISPFNYNFFDCQMFADIAKKQNVTVTELADLTDIAPCVGYGGVIKSSYQSIKTGKTIFVLERTGMYDCDAYGCECWQFHSDFSNDQAITFLQHIDNKG